MSWDLPTPGTPTITAPRVSQEGSIMKGAFLSCWPMQIPNWNDSEFLGVIAQKVAGRI
jgi:hypothetical protein